MRLLPSFLVAVLIRAAVEADRAVQFSLKRYLKDVAGARIYCLLQFHDQKLMRFRDDFLCLFREQKCMAIS